ncbi:MAG: cyclic di-GMP phosphodiesterase [Actinomycetota bacterium]|jgi:putative two-component system response regulator|nr:cyclic di-GMP phosphodiesterase [Actinomycetota bacterium]
MHERGSDRSPEVPTIKVLIVDDDPVFLRTMGRLLTNAGYTCREAASGADARAYLNTEDDIAAVLCDVRMPEESGLDLVATLAADCPGAAVVMTTGVEDPHTAAIAFDLGVYGYLIKPFTNNEILITLAGALRRRDLEAVRRSEIDGLERSVARFRTLHGVLAVIETVAPGASSADEAELIERLSRAMSLRADETGAHIQRMSRYAAVLADAVGYHELSADEVRLATALHDVGKIGVPDSILMKPGPLSPEERVAMQRHAQIGYQLLAGSTSSLLEVAARVALGHHEWWDGGGYPRGLQRDEIPLEARIAAVANVFDGLTSDRPYRRGVPIDAAIAAMTENRGRQFEPRLLDAFLSALDELTTIRSAYPDRDEPRIRVLVVDGDEVSSQRIMRLLAVQPTITVVAGAATVREAEKAAVAYDPDVVLIDFDLPDGDGATATQAIRALIPKAKVVMLTDGTRQGALVRAIEAGCAGFVAKVDSPHKLVGVIRSAHEEEAPAVIKDLPRLLAQLRPTSRGLGWDLGPRELEVLRLVAGGLPNRALAEHLHLSLNTVRNHVQNILYKLGAHSKLEAVATAVREGVIERHLPVTPREQV